jgi:hypothetical protein
MPRVLHHTAYARQPFEKICRQLDADPMAVVGAAADAAVDHANHLVANVDAEMSFFAPHDDVDIKVWPLSRKGDSHASMYLAWAADANRRLLPNVDGRLDIVPLIADGPAARTVLSLHGHYAPASDMFDDAREAILGRRVVDAAMHHFLECLAEGLEADCQMRQRPG